MHLLPVGETPGWSTPAWLNLELNHANVWNKEFTMIDRRTKKEYTYAADFEQSSAIAELGFALNEEMALSFEIPYANRNGGFLDDFIDQFHQLIGSNRFLRHLNEPFGNNFSVQNDGVDRLASKHGQGVGNTKVKFKWWLWKLQSLTPGACECGFALSAQVKFPTQPRKFGLSSGTNDYSVVAHLGFPIGDYGGAWFTSALTKLGDNQTFKDWPMRRWQQMHELTIDLGFGPGFGLMLQGRAESPLMMRDHLDFKYTYTDDDDMKSERIASGWNSLVYWRGSQAFGFRYLWPEGSMINALMMEDWGIGNQDGRSDWLYVNNAPDVAFMVQTHLTF